MADATGNLAWFVYLGFIAAGALIGGVYEASTGGSFWEGAKVGGFIGLIVATGTGIAVVAGRTALMFIAGGAAAGGKMAEDMGRRRGMQGSKLNLMAREPISGTPAVPQSARDIGSKINAGKFPSNNRSGGGKWENRNGQLPPGDYKKYDVNEKIPGQWRDKERIIQD